MTASLLLALRRRLWLLVLLPLAVGVGIFLATPTPEEAPRFVSTALIAADPTDEYGEQRVRQDALLVREDVVTLEAIRLYGSDLPPNEFRRRIEMETDTESLVISIEAEGEDPDEVQRYVQAYADAFVAIVQARANEQVVAEAIRSERALEEATVAYDTFVEENAARLDPRSPDPAAIDRREELFAAQSEAQEAYDAVVAEAETLASTYEVISAPRGSRPEPSTLSMLSEPPIRGAVAGLATLLGLVLVVALIARLHPCVTDRIEVEEAIDAPVLTMVPRVRARGWRGRRRVARAVFDGPTAEAYRSLQVHLQVLSNHGQAAPASSGNGSGPTHDVASPRRPTVAVVSPAPGDGKTTTAAMLALSFAETDAATLVLGCDFRRPTIHMAFDVPGSPGFTDHRGVHPPLELGDLVRTDPRTGVRVLPSGRASSYSKDAVADATVAVHAARAAGDVVVLDTAPVLVASETSQLAALADFVVLVVHAGRTSMRALTEAATTLRLNDIEITGVVLIGSPEASAYGYYDGSGRGSARARGADTSRDTSTDDLGLETSRG